MNRNSRKIASLLLVVAMVFLCCAGLVSCGGDEGGAQGDDGVLTLSFAQANTVEEMQKHDGKKVSVVGYMSTLSPVNGQFMYLMNMPYQSCPFCVPNTTQLSNTLAIYSKNGKKFEFTDMLIRVEGILEFGDYTDEYGYEYGYRIVDATYTKVDTSELDEQFLLWQQLASTGVVGDVYTMYDYVHFTCFWGTYTATFQGGSDYLYPDDAKGFLETDGAQYNYGYKDGYFDDLVSRIEAVDKEAFSALVENIRKAEALSKGAVNELQGNQYVTTSEYSTSFGDGRTQYKLKGHDSYTEQFSTLTSEFTSWIASWEIK